MDNDDKPLVRILSRREVLALLRAAGIVASRWALPGAGARPDSRRDSLGKRRYSSACMHRAARADGRSVFHRRAAEAL